MFFLCDSGNLYFVDFYCYKDSGVLIVSVLFGNGEVLVEWIDKMMNFYWNCFFIIGLMIEVIYN